MQTPWSPVLPAQRLGASHHMILRAASMTSLPFSAFTAAILKTPCRQALHYVTLKQS